MVCFPTPIPFSPLNTWGNVCLEMKCVFVSLLPRAHICAQQSQSNQFDLSIYRARVCVSDYECKRDSQNTSFLFLLVVIDLFCVYFGFVDLFWVYSGFVVVVDRGDFVITFAYVMQAHKSQIDWILFNVRVAVFGDRAFALVC